MNHISTDIYKNNLDHLLKIQIFKTYENIDIDHNDLSVDN